MWRPEAPCYCDHKGCSRNILTSGIVIRPGEIQQIHNAHLWLELFQVKVVTVPLPSQSEFFSEGCYTHLVPYRNEVPNHRVRDADELVDPKVVKAVLWSCRIPEDLFNTLQQFSRFAIWSHGDCFVNSNSACCNWKLMFQSKKSSPFTDVTVLKRGSETPNHYSSCFFILTLPNLPFWRKTIRETVNPSQIPREYFLLNLMFQYGDVSGDTSLPMHRRAWTDLELILPKLWAD